MAFHPASVYFRLARGTEHDLLLHVEQSVPLTGEVWGQPCHMAIRVLSRFKAESAGGSVLQDSSRGSPQLCWHKLGGL